MSRTTAAQQSPAAWCKRHARLIVLGVAVAVLAVLIVRSGLLGQVGPQSAVAEDTAAEASQTAELEAFELKPLEPASAHQLHLPPQPQHDPFGLTRVFRHDDGESDRDSTDTDSRAAARELAQRVRVDATMRDDRELAVINGSIYRAGQWIHGWQIVEIHHRHIVLERDGQRVQLDTQR